MAVETIKAGTWIFTEGGVPEYFIYKLLEGQVSVHKNNKKVREIRIEGDTPPITLGISALLSRDRLHTADIHADTDLIVHKVYTEKIRQILANEVPPAMRENIAMMAETIAMGNALISMRKKFDGLPLVKVDVSDAPSPETREVLSEIQRMYRLTISDVEELVTGRA